MQVGSLVECVNDIFPDELYRTPIKFPVKGSYYLIREIGPNPCGDNKISVLLEEIINQPRLCELCVMCFETRFGVERFRELVPPINLEEALRKEEPEQQEVLIQEEELIKEEELI
jgi:hypothetical protein